jgi:flagellar L-ring protein precursor FlgH
VKTIKVLGVGFWVLGLAASVWGQTKSDENYGSLFPADYKNPAVDRTARGVGDILTVVISESSSSNMAASTSGTKKDSNQVGLPLIGALKLPLIKQIIGDLSTSADSTVSGQGSTTASSRFSARISVIVKQVLPNGNMVVEGTRWIKVNKEETNITFTGLVRRDDVRADNTVISENVAEAKITNVSKGLIADRQRRGFITRFLDWLF